MPFFQTCPWWIIKTMKCLLSCHSSWLTNSSAADSTLNSSTPSITLQSCPLASFWCTILSLLFYVGSSNPNKHSNSSTLQKPLFSNSCMVHLGRNSIGYEDEINDCQENDQSLSKSHYPFESFMFARTINHFRLM